MSIISRPASLFILLLIFFLAGVIGGPGFSFDVAVIHWLAEIRHGHPQFTSVAVLLLTQLGSIYATLGLGLLASAWLAVAGKRENALLLALTVIVERLTVDGLKLAIDRPRPDFDLHPVVTSSSSFPSGHSANSMAVYVAVALIAIPQRWRRPAVAAALCLSIVIGFTRSFLGVHWPTDVIGGWAWGLLVAGLALTVGRRSGTIEAQHDVVGGHLPPASKD